MVKKVSDASSDNVTDFAKKDIKVKKSLHKKDFIPLKTNSDTENSRVEEDKTIEKVKKRKIVVLPDEVDFVRGKKKRPANENTPSIKSDNLFTEEQDASGDLKSEDSAPKRKKLKEDFELGKPLDDLTYKKLSPGMLVLGVASEVGEVDVVVNLPHGLTGFIKGTDISEEFNKMLEKGSEEEEDMVDEEEELDICDMISVGQYVICSIIDITTANKTKKVNLTTKPEIVNKNVKSGDLHKHMVLQGVVSSLEDHGYMVNLGIPGTTAFLNKVSDREIKKCDIVTVVVNSVSNNNVILGLYETKSKTLSDKVLTNFTSLLPGHLLNVNVKKQSVNGLRCSFLGGMQGMMHVTHLTDLNNTKSVSEVYPVKRKITARVLLVDPGTKHVLLSSLPCHVTMTSPALELKKGDVIEEVEVVRVMRRGVFCAIDEGITGFAHVSKLQDKELEKIGANHKAGTKHKARVMGFRLADNLVQLSLKPSDISKPFLSYHDIKPCSVVMATVVSIEEFGLVVKLADNIRGLVPKVHLADITIKNPALKFKPKQKVKAKVLTVDPAKRRLTLTLKRSIIKNSTADITAYEELEKGQQVTGWVAAIKNFGIIMNFSCGLRGLVHATDISNVPLTLADIAKLYKLGQVLSCRVVRVEAASKKLHLSFNLLEELGGTNTTPPSWARRGQILPCTVSTNKPEGLTVILDASKEEAFLPSGHLTDHASLIQPKLLHFKPGTKLPQVLILSKRSKKITVSAKPSLITWTLKLETLPKIADLKVGDLVPGYIKDFQDYGCFVEIPNGLVGLCPKARLANHYVSNPRDVYTSNQSVMCKITDIDIEKERLLVTLKPSDLEDPGAGLMQSYFAELEVFGEAPHLEVGEVVEAAEVTRITPQGLMVKIENNSGFVPLATLSSQEHVGGTVRGVVLDYDPASRSYVLSCSHELVAGVMGKKRKKLAEGEEEEGKVVLVTEEFFLVVIPAKGYRFGYVHRRQHGNDNFVALKDVKCGDVVKVIVQHAKKGKRVILSIPPPASSEDASSSEKKKKSKEEEDVKFDDIKIGTIYPVTVRSVKALQLNVQLGRKIKGRVHITEIKDTVEEGSNPLNDFKHGETLQAKLIGFRHSKTFRYLPITRTNFVMSVGEFSLRKSVLESNKVREIKEDEKVDEARDYISTLVLGQQISGFVRSIDHNGFIWICISPGVEARLWYTLTANTKEDIECWKDRFAIGQAITATVFNMRDNRIDLSLVGSLAPGNKMWALVKGTVPGVGLKLQLSARDWGLAPLTELNDHYVKEPLEKYSEEGMLVQCSVVECAGNDKRLILSTRKSRISERWKKSGKRKVTNPVISSNEDLEVGGVYSGYVKSLSASAGIFVALGHTIVGRVLLKNMSDNFLKNWEPMFPLGKLVRVYVLGIEPKIELSMKMSDLKKGQQQKQTTEDEAGDGDVQKCLDDLLMKKYQDSASEEEEEEDVEEEEDAPKIVFTQSTEDTTKIIGGGVSLAAALIDEKPEEEEEEEQKEETKEPATDEKKGKSLLKREKKRKKEEAEEANRKLERSVSSLNPETEDDFERSVASNPDSSSAWVGYMAYWLGSSNVEKARATAKRALDTINYRLEEEKLNIWSALFNLENNFGTHDGLMSACSAAVAVNDSKAVFVRLAGVLGTSQKYKEQDEIYNSVLLKKHKQSRKVWCNYATSLAIQSRLQDIRDILPKALKSLPQHKHIRTISHFAQLEYKHGDPNRGSTMYENVLNSYPARLDLWSVYLDKTIALNDVEQSRLLLDRVIGLKLPAKKMRFFFKRYIDFETALGDEDRVTAVKEKARQFMDSLEVE